MKSNLFLRVIIFLFCLTASFPLRAEPLTETEARQWTEEKGRQLLETFGEIDVVKKYATLDEMMTSYIDLEYVAKFVMGRYWRQMNNEQQDLYQSVFKRYALSIYKSFPLDFNTDKINFEIVKVIPDLRKTVVRTKIFLKPETTDESLPRSDIFVDFHLRKEENQIKIIDLKLGESSLILSYRSRFYEMIAQNDDDIEWFLEDLSNITEAAERTVQEKLHQAEY